MSASSGAGTGSLPEHSAVDESWVIRRAEQLLAEGNPGWARETIEAASGMFGRRAEFLWLLADSEFASGNVEAARECLDEALAAAPRSAVSVARQIRSLKTWGYWREALFAIQEAPQELRDDPLVRSEAGNFYRACVCPAHAVDSYGSPASLPRSARASRRWAWLRSGGPATAWRKRMRLWEERSLLDLWRTPAYIASLSTVGGIDTQRLPKMVPIDSPVSR